MILTPVEAVDLTIVSVEEKQVVVYSCGAVSRPVSINIAEKSAKKEVQEVQGKVIG